MKTKAACSWRFTVLSLPLPFVFTCLCADQHKHIPGTCKHFRIISLIHAEVNGSTSHPIRNWDSKSPLMNANLIDWTLSTQNHIKHDHSLDEFSSLFSSDRFIQDMFVITWRSPCLVSTVIGSYLLLMEWFMNGRESVWPQISLQINIQDSQICFCWLCAWYSEHTLHEYAEVEQWWLSCLPNCVGLEGLSESPVTSPVSMLTLWLGSTWWY